MLTSRQRLIGHSRALLLWSLLCVAALMGGITYHAIWNVPPGAVSPALASLRIPVSRDSSSEAHSQPSQAPSSDSSDDDSPDDDLIPAGHPDVSQPDAVVLLPPFSQSSLVQLPFFNPRSLGILPSEPPPRLPYFLPI